MKDKLLVAYSDDYLNWQLGNGDGNHMTKPIRAKLATEQIVRNLGDAVEIIEPKVLDHDRKSLESIHDLEYVSEVIDFGISGEWSGQRPIMGHTAFQMFAGTARITEKIIAGEARVGFNPQGAKHHAQRGWSEGFCVFNDFAWAAKEFEKNGLRAAYIDWDVNAGDGVQNLLERTTIPTFSIHGHGIYPAHSNTWDASAGRNANKPYIYADPDHDWYNYVLPQGAGDAEFAWAIEQIAERIAGYQPDVILLATGADAHESDLWGLKYTYEGYEYAAGVVAKLANQFSNGRVLIGGAGGYRPYDATPQVWSKVVTRIYQDVQKEGK